MPDHRVKVLCASTRMTIILVDMICINSVEFVRYMIYINAPGIHTKVQKPSWAAKTEPHSTLLKKARGVYWVYA